ncbi:MAG TPA: hypothetical protein VE860_11000 [Chthoniobacterales bacterium]|nr:hypothetical protein [Chthoniobacterales bacterium]
MSTWRSLLLVYPAIRAEIAIPTGPRFLFEHSLSDQELSDATESFKQFPSLVDELTLGKAKIQSDIQIVPRGLTSLTETGEGMYWPSPANTRQDIDKLAPGGRFDSIFVFWPQQNLIDHSFVPCAGWGLGMAASDWSNGATYAAVGNAESWVWRIPVVGEVWLHEWLHGVCAYFAGVGHKMPDGDADGGARHGYLRSPISGWTDYYRDLMRCNVLDSGILTGIPLDAWQDHPNSKR